MESVKKRLTERTKKNGIYVHYSPPKVVPAMTPGQIRQWARGGDVERLELVVLDGQGHRLLGETSYEPKTSNFLRTVPQVMAKCEALHGAVARGSLSELQELLQTLPSESSRNKYVLCRDAAGVGLLHKAVYFDFQDIARWLVENYPFTVHQRDSEGRTPLHYTAVCRDPRAAAALLEAAGAARGARDAAGRTPAHYRTPALRSRLQLPDPPPPPTNQQTTADMPREQTRRTKTGLVIKPSNIRIWCHDCDLGRLQRVVWEGQGSRLLTEVSNQPIVKKFLEAVPYIMNTIRDATAAIVNNDLDALQNLTSHPAPPVLLSSRDANNMTFLHKAAGLGNAEMVRYIVERWPQGINDVDNFGRTPLHYAASFKGDRDAYDTLRGLGAEDGILDDKQKTAGYYLNRPTDIDRTNLVILPEAPRTASNTYPASWEWRFLESDVISELNKKSRRRQKTSSENPSRSEPLNSVSNQFGGINSSSTLESIKDLSDLSEVNEKQKPSNKNTVNSNENATGKLMRETAPKSMEDSPFIPLTELNGTHDMDDKEENDEEAPEHEATEENVNTEDKTEEIDENDTEQQDIEDNNRENISDAGEKSSHLEYIGDHSDENKDDDELRSNEPESKDTQSNKLAAHEPESMDTQSNEPESHEPESHESVSNEHESNETKSKEPESNEPENSVDYKEESNEIYSKNHDEPEDQTYHRASASNLILTEEAIDDSVQSQNEDDEDVQVQGESESEYGDSNLRSTAEASDTASAKRGSASNGPNTQESLIEGLVNAEPEIDDMDATLEPRDDSVPGDMFTVINDETDPEVTQLISSSNMEMLAALVLNGEGGRLLGRRSQNEELQAFLDNVPIYMKKIKRVHLSAREGNIRDLQAALDRRKFAIARDPISPSGATPLHVATLFGKTNIIKYLGGRFPETLSAVDFEGRTALHYAAVIPDNGHYYNLLQHLGANAKDLDDSGHSAEEYHENGKYLTLNQLLADFGVDNVMGHEMLYDRVPHDSVSARRALDEPDTLSTLERCFRLLDSARSSRTSLSASSNRVPPPLVISRFLRRSIFDKIKHRITKLDHDLFDVIWPAVKKLPDSRNIIQTVEEDFPGGVTAPDFYVYAVFEEFLTPLVKDIHNINAHSDLIEHPSSDFDRSRALTANPLITKSDFFVELNVDPDDEFVLSGYIECARNIAGFELPLTLSIGKLEDVERILTAILMQKAFARFNDQSNLEYDQKGGTYYTMNEVLEKPSELRATLAAAGLLISLCDGDDIDDKDRLHGKHWPYGRGVYISDDKTVAIWINVHDHMRVITCTPPDAPGELGIPFSRLNYIMSYLHDKLDFVWDPKLGYLSSRPTYLGCSMHFNLIVSFPGLTREPENMKHLCAVRGLQYRETLSPDIIRLSNYQSLGVSETQCFNDFTAATANLLHLERDLSMQNSAHIATMLSNIFKRKRSSLIGSEKQEHV